MMTLSIVDPISHRAIPGKAVRDRGGMFQPMLSFRPAPNSDHCPQARMTMSRPQRRATNLTHHEAAIYFTGMQSRRDATLNLASLLHHAPGSESEVEAEGLLTPSDELLEADGLLLDGPLEWRVRVFNTGGDDDFVVDGEVRGTAVLDCRRCLTRVPVEIETDFIYPMTYRPSVLTLKLDELDDEEEERLLFGNPTVDFAQLLTQLFAIEAPLTALCKQDCLGLDEEGVNLNEHPELAKERAKQETPSPFAALSDALKDLEPNS